MNSIRKMPWSNSANNLVHSLGGYLLRGLQKETKNTQGNFGRSGACLFEVEKNI